jgi:TRAP-type C4-dicarboxylate transport system permease small subunit
MSMGGILWNIRASRRHGNAEGGFGAKSFPLEPSGGRVTRLLLRCLAYLLLATSFGIFAIDATRFVETNEFVSTPVARVGIVVAADQPDVVEAFVKGHIPYFLWDPFGRVVLALPAVLVLCAFALLLFQLSRPRRRGLGFLI